jgi:tetratricopeptide (TPR) repeat protein
MRGPSANAGAGGDAGSAALRGLVLALLAVALAAPVLHAAPPRPAGAALAACESAAGSLPRFLLCLDLEARRARETHADYERALETLLDRALDRLPDDQGRKPALALLSRLHHARQVDTRYATTVTLVDALDRMHEDPRGTLWADCDLFGLLNLGVAERYYGDGAPRGQQIGLLRTRHDHVVTVSLQEGRITGLLETVDGSVAPVSGREATSFAALLRAGARAPVLEPDLREPAAAAGPAAAEVHVGSPRPMTEREVVALYLADIGLALQIDGEHAAARTYFDAALTRNAGEYLAHLGRALSIVAAYEAGAGLRAGGGAACDGPAPALDEAEAAAREASRIEPGADGPYAVLGRIALRRCDVGQAQDRLRHALALRPDPVTYYHLALAAHTRQAYDEAIDAAREGVKRLETGDPRQAALGTELDYLLALAHAFRAEATSSGRDLRRAMTHFAAVAAALPDDHAVARLGAWIDEIDHAIGPVEREHGWPARIRDTFDAELAAPPPLRAGAPPP